MNHHCFASVPPLELAKLWGELVEAYHGCNGFGGDTAELYAFRFQRFNPVVHTDAMKDGDTRREASWRHYLDAAKSLHSLVSIFCEEFDCIARIDGLTKDSWLDEVQYGDGVFDHRVHVRILNSELTKLKIENKVSDIRRPTANDL